MCRIILQCFIVYIYCLFVYGWFTEAVKLLKKQNACSKTKLLEEVYLLTVTVLSVNTLIL